MNETTKAQKVEAGQNVQTPQGVFQVADVKVLEAGTDTFVAVYFTDGTHANYELDTNVEIV